MITWHWVLRHFGSLQTLLIRPFGSLWILSISQKSGASQKTFQSRNPRKIQRIQKAINLPSCCVSDSKYTSEYFWTAYSPSLKEKYMSSMDSAVKDRQMQALNMTQRIEDNYQEKKSTDVLYADLSAAYDTVWIKVLKYKVTKLIPDMEVDLAIHDLLSNWSFCVSAGRKTSRWKRLKNGLPQGSVLAPILFNFSTYDTPSQNAGNFFLLTTALQPLVVRITGQSTKASDKMPTLIELADYYSKRKLHVNPSKCQTVLYHLGPKKQHLKLTLNAHMNYS